MQLMPAMVTILENDDHENANDDHQNANDDHRQFAADNILCGDPRNHFFGEFF